LRAKPKVECLFYSFFSHFEKGLPRHVHATVGGETVAVRFWGGEVTLHVSANGLRVSSPGEPQRAVRGHETLSEIVWHAIAAQSERRLRWIASAAAAGTTFRKKDGGIMLQFGPSASCWARLALAPETGLLQMQFSPIFCENVAQRDAQLLRLFQSLAFADVAAAHRLLQVRFHFF
jgi:hypothetical protein